MKKFMFVVMAVIAILFASSCNLASSGHSSASKHVMPKFANYTALFANVSGAKKNVVGGTIAKSVLISDPGTYDGYAVTQNFSPEHCVPFDVSTTSATIAQLSTPPFNGFTMANYADGDTWTSTFFNRTMKTTVSISADENILTFTGKCNDGGGSYKLVINSSARSFTLETYLIFDAAAYITSYAAGNTKDLSAFERVAVYVYQIGNFDSTGSYTAGSGYATYFSIPITIPLKLSDVPTTNTARIGNVDNITTDDLIQCLTLGKAYFSNYDTGFAERFCYFMYKSGPNFYISRDDTSAFASTAGGTDGGGWTFLSISNIVASNPNVFSWGGSISDSWENSWTNITYDNTTLYDFMKNFRQNFFNNLSTIPHSIWLGTIGGVGNECHWCVYQNNGGKFNFMLLMSNNLGSNQVSFTDSDFETQWNADTLPSDFVTPPSMNASVYVSGE